MISYKISKNFIIVIINASIINEALFVKLNDLYSKYKKYQKVLDITNLKNIDYKLMKFINKSNIKLINKNTSNFLSLFLTKADKYLKIYNSEQDLVINNTIVKRRLKLYNQSLNRQEETVEFQHPVFQAHEPIPKQMLSFGKFGYLC